MASTSWFLACILCCLATVNMASLLSLNPHLRDDVTAVGSISNRRHQHVFLRHLGNAAITLGGERGRLKSLFGKLVNPVSETPGGPQAATSGSFKTSSNSGFYKAGDSSKNPLQPLEVSATGYHHEIQLMSATPKYFLGSTVSDRKEQPSISDRRARSLQRLSRGRMLRVLCAIKLQQSSHMSPQLRSSPHGQVKSQKVRASRGALDPRIADPSMLLAAKRNLPQLSTLNDLTSLTTMLKGERDRRKVEFYKFIFDDMLQKGR